MRSVARCAAARARVILHPTVSVYDVRKREFGTDPPHSFDKQEVESVVVELRSKRPRCYRFQFAARWYDAKQPDKMSEVRSEVLRVEFRPDVSDLLGKEVAEPPT